MEATIQPEEMAIYKATARKKAAKRKAEIDTRFGRAWEVVSKGAAMLREQFGAHKVVVFGSILNRRYFHQHSDIDFAAWGISEEEYLEAVGAVLDLDADFCADLVRMEEARSSLRKVIEREGQEV